MKSNQKPTKKVAKVEEKPSTAQSSKAQASSEYKVFVPSNHSKKRYSILQFNGTMNVEPGNWPKQEVLMAREDNRAQTVGSSEIIQEYGEGSEYGRAVREEARRKKYGRQAKVYQHDKQPWKMTIKDQAKDGKTRQFRSVCEGGAGAHSDYWIFLKSGNNFYAHKVEDWYRFMPDRQQTGLDMDQVEEQFQMRNKVLNQFALKAKIQNLKDQNAEEEKKSKPLSLKIKDEFSSGEEEADIDVTQMADDEDFIKKKKNEGANEKKKDKRQRVDNADEVAAYESEDGQDEGREYDYMSDSGSDTSREELNLDDKLDKELVAVGDETAMREDVLDEEEDESEQEGEDEEAKQKRQLLKKLSGQKEVKPKEEIRLTAQVDKRDSSDSDTDDPDKDPTSKFSFLFVQPKGHKRHHEDDGEVEGDVAKHAKLDSPKSSPSTQQPSSSHQATDSKEFTVETIRYLLRQRPYSSKELTDKFYSKKQGGDKEQILTKLANILKTLNPTQTHRMINGKKVLYLSLSK